MRLSVKAAVRREGTDELPVEVIVNSYLVDRRMIPADGSLHELEFDVPIDQSSWVAVRVSGSAHTNPIFVLVDGKPIRSSASSAEWLLKGVDQCWKNKQKTYAAAEQPDAQAAYEHAREVYRRILNESRAGG